VGRALLWSLALFGLLRTGWVEGGLLLPLTRLQRDVAVWYSGGQALPVEVGLACSAADVIALCLGVILAYPAPWPARLAGAGWGMGLILALNTVRIGTLGRVVAAAPGRFHLLHVYVWPAVLVAVVTAYVLVWMRRVGTAPSLPLVAGRPSRRFALCVLALLGLFSAAAPWLLQSAAVLQIATAVARAAGGVLGLIGLPATVRGNILATSHGGFVVTQECVATPLIPVYLAAALGLPSAWTTRLLAVLASIPLIVGLAVARLLALALPPAILASPLPLVHGFNQLLIGVVVVLAVAVHREGFAAGSRARVMRRGVAACAAGLGLAVLGGAVYTRALLWAAGAVRVLAAHTLTRLSWPDDEQGALWLLPAYQIGLLVALWLAGGTSRPRPISHPRRLALALVGLMLSQLLLLVVWGETAAHLGYAPHALAVRAWAVAGPLLAVWLAAYRDPRQQRFLRDGTDDTPLRLAAS
jgi:exosortase/archaeosortase family protein